MSSKFLLLSILTASLFLLSSGKPVTNDCLKAAGILRMSEEVRNPKKCSAREVKNIKHVMGYLIRYGYLPDKLNQTVFNAYRVREALYRFQYMTGLNLTHEIDDQTLQKMQEPRCGVKDYASVVYWGRAVISQRARGKWLKKDLTWSLGNFAKNTDMTENRQLLAIQNAFRRWSKLILYNLTQVIGKADIELSFETGNLGNNFTSDGPGRSLAHAFLPPDGRIYFDNAEYWTENSSRGSNLELVATHQIGHALGLPHNEHLKSIMRPIYPKYRPNFKPSNLDANRINFFYRTIVPRYKLCNQTFNRIEAAFRGPDNTIYLFVDSKYVINGATGQKYHTKEYIGVDPPFASVYSQTLRVFYSFTIQQIEAIHTFVTKGIQYPEPGFPKQIENTDILLPSAALRIVNRFGNERLILIKQGKAWFWDPASNMFSPEGGKPIQEIFPKCPSRVDAAISGDNNEVIFISGNKYYVQKANTQESTEGNINDSKFLKCSKND